MKTSTLKREHIDETEIQELALKIMKENQTKMQTLAKSNANKSMNISNLLNGTKKSSAAKAPIGENQVDQESARGRFGWERLFTTYIPYIFRSKEKYCALKIVESQVVQKYLTALNENIYKCAFLSKYNMTEAECRLLNEINFRHCDRVFGQEQFNSKDFIVRFADASELCVYLETCYNKLLNVNISSSDRCGFIRIDSGSVVPYTLYTGLKYLPMFYFEGDTGHLQLMAQKLRGWDLSYLKFCCQVQGIRNELFDVDHFWVISLDNVKKYYPPTTTFEDYWPSDIANCQRLLNIKMQKPIDQPPETPPTVSIAPQVQAVASQPVQANNNQLLQDIQAIYTSYGLKGAQPAYPVTLQKSTNPAVTIAYPMNPYRQIRPGYQTNIQMPSASSVYTNQSRNATSTCTSTVSHAPALLYSNQSATPIPQQAITNQQQQQFSGMPQLERATTEGIALNNFHTIPSAVANGPAVNNPPYKMRQLTVENRMIPCINMHRHVHNGFLTTIRDIVTNFFSTSTLTSFLQAMNVLKIQLYKPNSAQLEVLYQNGQGVSEDILLVPVQYIVEFMPQLKYMLGSVNSAQVTKQN